MKDFIKNIDGIDPKGTHIPDAERASFDFKTSALQELIFERFRSLTMIATVCFAVIGISLSFSEKFISNHYLAGASFVLAIFIAFISIGRYLFLVRSDIKDITKRINKMRELKWLDYIKWAKENQDKKGFKADFWPELLYVGLIISVLLFLFSFL